MRPCAWLAGLALYPESGVQRVDVQVRFSQQPLEFVVLGLQLTQPRRIRYVHAAVLGPPLVESGIAETASAAHLLDRHPGLGLLDEADDLLFGVSAVSNVRHFPGLTDFSQLACTAECGQVMLAEIARGRCVSSRGRLNPRGVRRKDE